MNSPAGNTVTGAVTRASGRSHNELRPVLIQRGYARHAEGSALIEFGNTRVLCTASVEEKVPAFLRGRSQGWLTAEYGMLPRATNTRTASITGAFVALHDAVTSLSDRGLLAQWPIRDFVAAVSVGIVAGELLLDLDYPEDSGCDTDMNVVMTGSGGFVEVQGTAEGVPFARAQMDALMNLAERGIRELIVKQRVALELK